MYWDVINVQSISPRTLRVTFADGLTGSVFIDASFCTGVFTALKEDTAVSSAFAENGVVMWENGLDLAPDTLHREIQRNANRHYVVNAVRRNSGTPHIAPDE
ncbi:MAG: DUF2442 domain-containing protein [Candidatus Methylumidiphilus sp.]